MERGVVMTLENSYEKVCQEVISSLYLDTQAKILNDFQRYYKSHFYEWEVELGGFDSIYVL